MGEITFQNKTANQTIKIRDEIERIESRYDPEHDIGIPEVTSTDMRIISMIERLTAIVEDQEKQIHKLKFATAGMIIREQQP